MKRRSHAARRHTIAPTGSTIMKFVDGKETKAKKHDNKPFERSKSKEKKRNKGDDTMNKLTNNLISVRSEIRRRHHDGITTISWVGGNKDIVADSQFLSFGFNYDFSKKNKNQKNQNRTSTNEIVHT